jgi:hypothetical protein
VLHTKGAEEEKDDFRLDLYEKVGLSGVLCTKKRAVLATIG